MIYFSLVIPLLGFVFSEAVFYHYSKIPVDHISQAEVYGVLFFDLLVTIGFHALSIYFLNFASPRFGRTWFAVVLILLLMVAGECAIRYISFAFGEPIHRMVADVMLSPFIYIFLPVIGIVSGGILTICHEIQR